MLTTRTLTNLIMQRIDILTKPDEFRFFWHTSFDRVRRAHRLHGSRTLSAAADPVCLPLSHPLASPYPRCRIL